MAVRRWFDTVDSDNIRHIVAAEPPTRRTRFLPHKNELIVPAVVPPHSKASLVPHHRLLEADCLVHPQSPARELRIRPAAAAAAAAAAGLQNPARLCKHPAHQGVSLRAVIGDWARVAGGYVS